MDTFDHPQRIQRIESLFSDTMVIDDFLSEEEFLNLLAHRDSLPSRVYYDFQKNPFKVFTSHDHSLPSYFTEKLHQLVPNMKLRRVNYLDRETPYQLHCDAGKYPNKIPYKGFIYSLDCPRDHGGMVIFKQYATRSVYFVNKNSGFSREDIKTTEHFPIFDLDSEGLEFLRNLNEASPPPKEIFPGDIDHIDDEFLKGMEVHQVIPHKRNRMIIFDSSRLHCSTTVSPNNYPKTRRLTAFAEYDEDFNG